MSHEKKLSHEAAQLAGDVMDEVSSQVELSQARSVQRNSGKKSTIPAVLGVVFLALTGLLLVTLSDSGPPLTSDEIRYYMLDEMSELAYKLDDYREEYGVLPNNRTVLGKLSIPALSYQRLYQNRYRISFREGDQSLVYESDESAGDFFAEVRGIE